MSDAPPPYSEGFNKQGGPNYGSVPAGAYQGPYQGPTAPQPGYPPAGAYQGPQGYPAGQQGYPAGQQGYPAGQQGYPAGAVPPPQGGYDQPKYPPAGAAQGYHQTYSVQPQTAVVMVGGCPACRVGVLEDDFTCLGVFCAIMFFPLGILCCLAMRQRRCVNCGAVFG